MNALNKPTTLFAMLLMMSGGVYADTAADVILEGVDMENPAIMKMSKDNLLVDNNKALDKKSSKIVVEPIKYDSVINDLKKGSVTPNDIILDGVDSEESPADPIASTSVADVKETEKAINLPVVSVKTEIVNPAQPPLTVKLSEKDKLTLATLNVSKADNTEQGYKINPFLKYGIYTIGGVAGFTAAWFFAQPIAFWLTYEGSKLYMATFMYNTSGWYGWYTTKFVVEPIATNLALKISTSTAVATVQGVIASSLGTGIGNVSTKVFETGVNTGVSTFGWLKKKLYGSKPATT